MSTVLAERPGLVPYRNDLTVRFYVYNGTGADELTPELDEVPDDPRAAVDRKGRDLAPHGTAAAYRRHYKHGEKPCEPCRVAGNIDRAERNERRRS